MPGMSLSPIVVLFISILMEVNAAAVIVPPSARWVSWVAAENKLSQ